jgi:ADP-ribose pyrophosphatase YjhB (NUDIX family)
VEENPMPLIWRWLEAIGMALVLLAAGTQLFVKSGETLQQDAARYRLEEKVDAVWSVLADYYSHSAANRSEAMHLVNFPEVMSHYVYAGQSDTQDLDAQVRIVSIWKAAMFLAGSLILVIAKFLCAARETA